jgi:hypothetical protein
MHLNSRSTAQAFTVATVRIGKSEIIAVRSAVTKVHGEVNFDPRLVAIF